MTTPPPIVLDTCVFRNSHFIDRLAKYRPDKFLPPVAFSELSIHYYNKGWEIQDLWQLVRDAGIELVQMGPHEAALAGRLGHEHGDWPRRWRDYMIAAHAYEGSVCLVTHNTKDFAYLGNKVFDPGRFCDLVGLT